MNLPELSLKKPTVILLIFAGLSVWGVFSFKTISRREDPKIEISYAAVLTIYPGASALEVERKVTRPIEEKLQSLSSIEEISSVSKSNVSMIFLKVNYNTDFAQQWDLVRARVAQIRPILPSTVDGPKVIDDFGDVVGMIISIHSPSADQKVLDKLSERLKNRFLGIKSVGKVDIKGLWDEEIAIEGTLDDFLRYNFSPVAAQKLLGAQNMGIPGGVKHGDNVDYRIVPPTEYSNLNELKNQIFSVSKENGEAIKLGQVFDIKRRYADPQNMYYRTNGENSVVMNITMKTGFDITKMGTQVRKVVDEFKTTLPEGYKITILHDQPRHVDENLGGFLANLLQSLLLVAISMALLLGIRSSLLVSLGLPLAVLISIALMPMLKIDLERASVAAFIVALGMLVDNSIIVVDHIHNLLDKGYELSKACISGAQELIMPVLGGTVASILAFFPMLLLPDEMGAYIRSLPWVLTLSLGASFFISVTITPLLAYFFLRFGKKHKNQEDKKPKKPGFLSRGYFHLMSFSLRAWPLIIIAVGGIVFASTILFKNLGVSFFPVAERDQFVIEIWTPEGSSIKNTAKYAEMVEDILKKDKRVVSTLTVVGNGLDRFWIALKPELNSFNLSQILVNTKTPGDTVDMVKELKGTLSKVPGARIIVKQLLLGIAIDAPVSFKIYGEDINQLKKISDKIQKIMLKDPGIENTRDNFGVNSLAYKVEVDESRALKTGITRAEIALALITANNGLPVTRYTGDDDPVNVVLKVRDSEIKTPEDLLRMAVSSTATGATFPINTLGVIKPMWEPGKINRDKGRRAININGYTKQGVLANDVLKRLLPTLKKMKFPQGYEFTVEGEEKERAKTFGDLTIVFGVTIFALFAVLVFQFGTLRQAVVVLGSVPLALIGGILGLIVTGNSFGFSAFIGMIALAGVVIKNAVVWVDFVETSVASGMEYRTAVIEAGVARLRPILLTAATTIGGLIPLGISKDAMWSPMAWTLMFGLAVSTVLTLIVIPVLYFIVVRHQSASAES
ncbi:MAG: efflux RND transporter permease subunit [Deltaproteobacteria bacterium]|nr:efflux RND transporter permease subunit [Deltaproteobacteria bacterium]